MYSTGLSRFTDDLISEAFDQLDYELEFKDQTAQEDVDYAEMKRSYDVFLDEAGFSGEISLNASVPTDSDSPRYELKITGMNKVQEEIADEVERRSLSYLERVSHHEEGEVNVIEGFISEDIWSEYSS